MNNLANDPTKDVVVIINDYYEEYGRALQALAKKLKRPLRGILLVNKSLKESGQNLTDSSGVFTEVVCDFTDDANLRATLRQFEDNLLLVTCVGESSQMDFKRVLPHIPYVPGPSERSLEWATHKGKMRAVLGAYDAKLVPKSLQVVNATNGEIARILGTLSFPMIIKPTGLSDSTLVSKVSNVDELQNTLRNSFTALDETYRRNRGNGKPGIVVEEFMEGDLYSIDGYVNEHGQAWMLPLLRSKSAYHVGLEGFYIYQTETYHDLTTDDKSAGKQAATSAVRALGLRSCIAHIELYKTRDGWKIVELGARPGALRQEIYEVSFGVDHSLNDFLIKIGEEPKIKSKLLIHSMVFKVYPDKKGRVQCIEGITEARFNSAVLKIDHFVEPGDSVLPVTNGGSVAVQGLLIHSDVTQLRNEVSKVRAAIKVKIRQPSAAFVKEPRKQKLLQMVA